MNPTSTLVRRSLDSGIRSDDEIESEPSALKGYFQSFLADLECAVERNNSRTKKGVNDLVDLTLDLESLEEEIVPVQQQQVVPKISNSKRVIATMNRPQQAPSRPQASRQMMGPPHDGRQFTMDQLKCIKREFDAKNSYSMKLAQIMLKNLKTTLGTHYYEDFMQGRLPANWLPMVRMNDDNAPYVEFLVKSPVADQAPDSQLSDFDFEHITYSKYIVDKILESSGQLHVISSVHHSKNQCHVPNSSTNPTSRKSIPQRSLPSNHKRLNQVPPKKPRTSTPVKGVLSEKNQDLVCDRDDLNDSKMSTRTLPSRACRNRSLSYKT